MFAQFFNEKDVCFHHFAKSNILLDTDFKMFLNTFMNTMDILINNSKQSFVLR